MRDPDQPRGFPPLDGIPPAAGQGQVCEERSPVNGAGLAWFTRLP